MHGPTDVLASSPVEYAFDLLDSGKTHIVLQRLVFLLRRKFSCLNSETHKKFRKQCEMPGTELMRSSYISNAKISLISTFLYKQTKVNGTF